MRPIIPSEGTQLQIKTVAVALHKISKITIHEELSAAPQQKNIEHATFLCNLGSSGTGTGPADVMLPCPDEVSDKSSNFINCPICCAAR